MGQESLEKAFKWSKNEFIKLCFFHVELIRKRILVSTDNVICAWIPFLINGKIEVPKSERGDRQSRNKIKAYIFSGKHV